MLIFIGMAFILTFLLVAGLEAAYADKESQVIIVEDQPAEPDLCVGCDDKKEEKNEQKTEDIEPVIQVIVDPVTGEIQYVIKVLTIQQQ